jgi:hypothetical protein
LIIQGTKGNDDNDPPGEDAIDGSMSADIEIDTAIGKNGEAFLLMEMGAGDGLQDDEIVSFWGPRHGMNTGLSETSFYLRSVS